MNLQDLNKNRTYHFRKSGAEVRVLGTGENKGPATEVTVERITSGKAMVVLLGDLEKVGEYEDE